MLRKLIFAVCALALTVASCGRQVTPNRSGTNGVGLLPGQMQIKFNTQGNLDFVNNTYVLAFDTNCDATIPNCMPYPVYGTAAQNYLNWSFEIALSQPTASSAIQIRFWQFVNQGQNGQQKVPIAIPFAPGVDIVANPNCNGNNTQFCLTIYRRIFNGLVLGPSPSPAPTPIGTLWYINWMVASPGGPPNGQVIFAPGNNGINDTNFQFPAAGGGLNMTAAFDQLWVAQPSPPWQQAPSQASQIAGGEVLNNP